jgi:hypothetical protein
MADYVVKTSDGSQIRTGSGSMVALAGKQSLSDVSRWP